MKAVLGLAILCCFVIGSLGVGCPAKNCKNMLDCACKNQEAIKAKVVSGPVEVDIPGKNAKQLCYQIDQRQNYRNNKDFEKLVVPVGCDWNLKLNDVYYFFGHELSPGSKTLKVGQPKGFKKHIDNASEKQKEGMRKIRKNGCPPKDVKCPCLAAPERGTVCIDGDQSPGTEAYYECEFDRIGGDSDRMCQRDGTWTGEEAVCSTVCGATDLNVETNSSFTLPRYFNHMDCTYTISGNGDPIVLSFTAFDIEFHNACIWDFVQITGSDGTNFGKYCGTSLPGPFTSTGFTVHFSTDYSVTNSGFTMAFSYA